MSSLLEFNDYCSHVVAAQTLALGQVLWAVLVHHHLHDGRQSLEFAIDYGRLHLLLSFVFLVLRILQRRLLTQLCRARWSLVTGHLLLGCNDEVASLLRCHAVPDTVTGADHEVQFWGQLHLLDLRKRADSHFFRQKLRIFVLPVTNRSADCDNAIDTPIFHDVSRGQNTRSFRR